MKINLYTNNAYDTVAFVNDDNRIVSHWDAAAKSTTETTALDDALNADDLSDWDDQGHDIDADEFADGNDLILTIYDDGSWHVADRDLLAARLRWHLGARHPIVQALTA